MLGNGARLGDVALVIFHTHTAIYIEGDLPQTIVIILSSPTAFLLNCKFRSPCLFINKITGAARIGASARSASSYEVRKPNSIYFNQWQKHDRFCLSFNLYL